MNILERIKTKPEYKYLVLILLIIGVIYIQDSELREIKNNPNIEVQCNIKGKGIITIDKNKIVDILDDGTFVFENGYSQSCTIIRGDK